MSWRRTWKATLTISINTNFIKVLKFIFFLRLAFVHYSLVAVMNEVTGYILLNCGKEAIHMNWCNIIVLLFHCTDCIILPSGFDCTILISIWRIRYFKFKKVQKLCIALLFSLRQIFYFSGHCMTHKPMLINVIVVSSSLVKFSSMFINASLIREITILAHISFI